jgi:4-amino-4-deoxy-L-arabinose transferase-like glycosyltransferase
MTPLPVAPTAPSRLFQRHWTWWFMVATLVIVAAVRLRLLNLPLERDEGEYAYAGQLMLQGIPPYQLAYNMKFPGTYAAYAVIMALFGETPAGIHFGVLCLTTLTALMLFWLGKKMLDPMAGIVAASAYAVLAASPSMLGLAGHATHFCAFFATAGLCAMWQARQNRNWLVVLAAGLLFGTTVLMKQQAALIALWASLAWMVWCFRKTEISFGKRLAALAVFGMGTVLPFALCCLILWRAGVFRTFWFWTVEYAWQYASVVPLSYAPQLFWKAFLWVTAPGFLLWLLAGAGLVLLWLDERLKPSRKWLLGFYVASALAVCPDFYFRKHYFLIVLPALALLAGVAISTINHGWTQKDVVSRSSNWPVWVWVAVVATTLLANSDIWFRLSPIRATFVIYGNDPFGQAAIIAKYIRINSPPDARVAVIGSEPEIYFLARRHSATGYIYTYELMEPQPFAQKMQNAMIGEIETNTPEFVVFADNPLFSWGRRPDSDPRIFEWWNSCQTNYVRVGLVDVGSRSETEFRFGVEDVARYGKIRGIGLEIFRHK